MLLHARLLFVFAAILQQAAGQPDFAEMKERIDKLPPEQRAQMMQLMAEGAGMDSPGGMMGGPRGMPPPPKQIAVKKARTFMEEVQALLSTEYCQAKIKDAINVSPPEASTSDVEAAIKAIGPALDSLTRGLTETYGFTNGFEEAMVAVNEARQRKNDKKLQRSMEDLAVIITGKPSPRTAGRVPELDLVAEQFIKMGLEERKAAILEVEKKQEAAASDSEFFASAGEYLSAMRGMVKDGDSYPRDKVLEMLATRDKEASEADKASESKVLNILFEFLGKDDLKHIEKTMKELQNTMAGKTADEL